MQSEAGVNAFAGAERGVAIVTGGGRRVGAAISMLLAGRGLDVVVHYGSSSGGAAGVVRDIVSSGRRAVAVGADLRDPCRAAEHVFAAARDLGPVTVLINNAGVFRPAPFLETSVAEFDALLAAKLIGGLTFGFGFSARYDNLPLAGKSKLDTASTLSLVYGWSDVREGK